MPGVGLGLGFAFQLPKGTRGSQHLRVPPLLGISVLTTQQQPWHPDNRFWNGVKLGAGTNVSASPQVERRVLMRQEQPWHPDSRFWNGVKMGAGANVEAPVIYELLTRQEQPWHPSSSLIAGKYGPNVNVEAPVINELLMRQEQPWHPASRFWCDVEAPSWVLPGAAVDLDFAAGLYYGGTLASLLSITRASTETVTWADGHLTYAASGQLAISDLGLQVWESRTNVVLYNNDLTQAVWAATNIDPSLNATGPDNVANSASTITAGAINATILQPILLASSARYQTAYVKRVTGSGTVNMTMDGGATWTPITVTSAWTRVSIPTQTITNPIVGFQLTVSGDAIAVFGVQNENGTIASPIIPTTTTSATRAADNIAGAGALSALPSAGSIVAIFTPPTGTASAAGREYLWANTDSGNSRLALRGADTGGTLPALAVGNGSGVSTISLASNLNAGTVVKVGASWGASISYLAVNAAAATVNVPGNGWGGSGGISLGCLGAGAQCNSVIPRFTLFNSQLSQTQLQTLTQ